MESSSPLPPFIIKTYDMVDDSFTDPIVSWSPTCNNSFVVWDFYEFSSALLPRFFKHSNFSSFVRQLNTYGFRKADPDRWEFSHEEFIRGQRHRLKHIHRKKPVVTSSATSVSGVPHAHGFTNGVLPSQEWTTVGHEQTAWSAESEVEQLRRERNVIMLELARLDGQHYSAHQQIKCVSDRLQAMEMQQQQIVAFVARTMCSPSSLYQYVNQAIAVDHSQAQQRLLENCLDDSNSSGARKRRRIMYADRGNMIADCTDYDPSQLQQQCAEEKVSSCENKQETATSMTTTSDDQETAASYDQKLLVELNLENDSNSTVYLDKLIQGGGNVTHNLAFQNKAIYRDASVPSAACNGMLEGVKSQAKMKRPIREGYALIADTEDCLQMVNLNLQPYNMSNDSPYFRTSNQIGNGDRLLPLKYMQANASNMVFEDLE